jgi:hypothetical protein
VKEPSVIDFCDETAPVAWFVSRHYAPGTGAPLGSTSNPFRELETFCALAANAASTMRAVARHIVLMILLP